MLARNLIDPAAPLAMDFRFGAENADGVDDALCARWTRASRVETGDPPMIRRTLLAILLPVMLLFGAVAPAHATSGTPVTIVSAVTVGPFTGTWSATGGINDSGTLVEPKVNFVGNGELHIVRDVTAAIGTFTLRIDSKTTFEPDGSVDFTGRWVVIAGTGAYRTLHGQGTRTAQIAVDSDVVMETLTGSVHFN